MRRRNINIIIVAFATIFAILTQIFIHPSVILFMLAFNIICLIHYRESAFIIAFHITSILLISGFFIIGLNLVSDPDLYMLFHFFVSAGSFVIVIVAFIVILQNRTEKGIEKSLIFIAIIFYIFYT
ncbi:MAG TPA: hypothetical protein VJ878_03105, partial [Candidatus Izemoplasmatales bacterium]|nr:hypothetical protein [Candidatus Izemoplasmatales bacterium]